MPGLIGTSVTQRGDQMYGHLNLPPSGHFPSRNTSWSSSPSRSSGKLTPVNVCKLCCLLTLFIVGLISASISVFLLVDKVCEKAQASDVTTCDSKKDTTTTTEDTTCDTDNNNSSTSKTTTKKAPRAKPKANTTTQSASTTDTSTCDVDSTNSSTTATTSKRTSKSKNSSDTNSSTSSASTSDTTTDCDVSKTKDEDAA